MPTGMDCTSFASKGMCTYSSTKRSAGVLKWICTAAAVCNYYSVGQSAGFGRLHTFEVLAQSFELSQYATRRQQAYGSSQQFADDFLGVLEAAAQS